jgi:hypothetical protein
MIAAAFILAFLVFCVGGLLLIFFSDRKRSIRRLGSTASAPNLIPFGTPVATFVDEQRAGQIARSAIQQVGAHDLTVLTDGTTIGWVGSSWTNIPRRAEYMVAVSREIQPDGSLILGCIGQPRFSNTLFGAGQSARLTRQLVAEVQTLVSAPSG